MRTQRDLELAMEQLSDMPPIMWALYAYACCKLLQGHCPGAVRSDGSFDIVISDVPMYSAMLEREIPKSMIVKIIFDEKVIGTE